MRNLAAIILVSAIFAYFSDPPKVLAAPSQKYTGVLASTVYVNPSRFAGPYDLAQLVNTVAAKAAVEINEEIIRSPRDPVSIVVPRLSLTPGNRPLGEILDEICRASSLVSYTISPTSVTVRFRISNSGRNPFTQAIQGSGSASYAPSGWLDWITAHSTNLHLNGGMQASFLAPQIRESSVTLAVAPGSTVENVLDALAQVTHSRWFAVFSSADFRNYDPKQNAFEAEGATLGSVQFYTLGGKASP